MNFSKQEINALIITTIIFAFMFSFTQWGPGKQADISIGLTNLLIGIFIVGISLLAHHLAQKWHATRLGFHAEQKMWWEGLIISLIFAIITQGALTIFFGHGTFIEKTKKRLGTKRPNIDLYDYGRICLRGPMMNIFLGATILTMSWIFGLTTPLISKIFLFNISYAFWNLLPIPPLDGSRLFFASRLFYIFMISSYAAYISLILFLNIFSFVYATIIGYIILAMFYYFVELNY